MRNLGITYLLLFLYGWSILKPISPYIDYAINKDYIAKVLCVNKEKKEMHCDGKCHLKANLKKASAPAAAADKIIKVEKDFPLNIVTLFQITFRVTSITIHQISRYTNFYNFDYSDSCFHPPTV